MERRLAAILAADVVGYSRLMEVDEEATARTLSTYREIVEGLVASHHGRVFGSAGDSVIAEFASPVEAVRCAVAIQRELEAHNVDLAEDRRMRLRIGVNLGDVMVEGDNLLGDGVNIAARLETLAEPGGISLARSVFDQVKKQLDLGYENLGEHEVKNIAEPVQVYRVLTGPEAAGKVVGVTKRAAQSWKRMALAASVVVLIGVAGAVTWLRPWEPTIEPASLERMAFPLPDKPSIAVLPFTNMSDDPAQEYFVDGMTEDLITDLARVSGLFVIARNSMFTYKGRAVKVREVAEELGVRYVLEGSVRRAGDRVRINAQLIDATTGGHLWAERFDRELKDMFALQDEVVGRIVAALEVRLTADERRSLAHQYTSSVQAYDVFLRGLREFARRSKEGNDNARALFAESIELDPKFVHPYAYLAWAHVRDFLDGWSEWPERSLEQAYAQARNATALDDSLPLTHFVMGIVQLFRKEHEKALGALETALSLDPNFANGYAMLLRVLHYSGRPDAGLEPMKVAMRLDPRQPLAYLSILGNAYFTLGRYEEAADVLKKAIARNPSAQRPHMWLAATYAQLGLMDEAEWEAEELLALDPDFSLRHIVRGLPFKNPAHLETIIGALRKAGLPE